MDFIFFDIILGFSIISILSILAYTLQYLDREGAIAGIVIGSIILVGGGWSALLIMMIFFIISVFSTRLKYNYKRHLGFGQEKGGKRGWRNTIANGSVAAISILIGSYFGGEIFSAAFLGAMATSMADTLATEIGLLSKSRPRLITNLSKKVGAGTSGGVSLLGELVLIGGSLMIGLLAFLFKFSEISIIGLILITLSGGIVGSHVDSILGATIQSMNKCIICGSITESNIHHNKSTESFKGLKIIDNNTVNFLSTLSGAIVASLVWFII